MMIADLEVSVPPGVGANVRAAVESAVREFRAKLGGEEDQVILVADLTGRLQALGCSVRLAHAQF